jgi:probable DNA metabolism protein
MSSPAIQVRAVVIEPTLAAWREAARPILQKGTSPELVNFTDGSGQATQPLFAAEVSCAETGPRPHVPSSFLPRAETVACHRSLERWNLLYRLLWRLQRNRDLLHLAVDDDVAQFRRLEHQVKRDLHKMHAFVRFRRIDGPEKEAYVAWHQPDHFVLPLAAPFFAERFAVMRWSILTPDASMHWDPELKKVTFGPGVPRDKAPQDDELEDLWRVYYGSIFNPARMNLRAMRAEMPMRYWKNLPELQSLPGLLVEAEQRTASMIEHPSPLATTSWVPADHSLPVLREAIPRCRGCELHACATQPVFGAGPLSAGLMLVGEQPGDEEDRRGQPFVGPAGRLLDELLAEVGIDRAATYVTNAVKHFKFVMRGKRRLHESPRLSEINACRPWLLAELDAVQPGLVLCLGASAAKSLLGAKFALMRDHGKLVSSPWAVRVMATLHPSAILRATDPERAADMRSMLLADLRQAKAIAT